MVRLVLLRIAESYFRHRWLHLVPILLVAIAAVGYFYLMKPQYASRAVLYVQGTSLLSSLTAVRQQGFSWITPAQATSGEIGELMRSESFVRAVIHTTPLEAKMSQGPRVAEETIEEVRKSVWAYAQGSNQVMITARDEDPLVAQQLVMGVIDSYLNWKINAELSQSTAAWTFYDGLVAEYGASLEAARDRLEEYIQAHPGPLRGERPALEQLEIERRRAEVELAASRYTGALANREKAQLAISQTEGDIRQTYYVLDAPRLPDRPLMSRRQMAMDAGLFLAVGIILSAFSVAGSALLDRSLRFPLDVKQGLGLPVLGTVPVADTRGWPVSLEEPDRKRIEGNGYGDPKAASLEHGNGHAELERVGP